MKNNLKTGVESAKEIINSESGAVGYLVAWLLGVPVSVLLIVFLLRAAI